MFRVSETGSLYRVVRVVWDKEDKNAARWIRVNRPELWRQLQKPYEASENAKAVLRDVLLALEELEEKV